jgi:hypothetical protein
MLTDFGFFEGGPGTVPVGFSFHSSGASGILTANGMDVSVEYHYTPVPGPIAGAGLPGLNLRRRWPSRLVATAAQNRVSIKRNPHTSFLRRRAFLAPLTCNASAPNSLMADRRAGAPSFAALRPAGR